MWAQLLVRLLVILPLHLHRLSLAPNLSSTLFFFSSRRRHTRFKCDWSSDVCSSDLRDMHIKTLMLQDGHDRFPQQGLVIGGEDIHKEGDLWPGRSRLAGPATPPGQPQEMAEGETGQAPLHGQPEELLQEPARAGPGEAEVAGPGQTAAPARQSPGAGQKPRAAM